MASGAAGRFKPEQFSSGAGRGPAWPGHGRPPAGDRTGAAEGGGLRRRHGQQILGRAGDLDEGQKMAVLMAARRRLESGDIDPNDVSMLLFLTVAATWSLLLCSNRSSVF